MSGRNAVSPRFFARSRDSGWVDELTQPVTLKCENLRRCASAKQRRDKECSGAVSYHATPLGRIGVTTIENH